MVRVLNENFRYEKKVTIYENDFNGITIYAVARHQIFKILDIVTFSMTILFRREDMVFSEWMRCNGIQIFRSTDKINFIKIGDIAGVCGSTSAPQPYDLTDINPVKNSFNYYRLELGGSGISDIIGIEIIELEYSGYQIRPNPISTEAKIFFENNKNQEHHLTIYDTNGNQALALVTKEEFFLSIWNMYVYHLTESGKKIIKKSYLELKTKTPDL